MPADLGAYSGARTEPLLIDALLRVQGFGDRTRRLATTVTGDTLPTWGVAGAQLPTTTAHARQRFERMASAPRASVVLGELCDRITVASDGPDGTAWLMARDDAGAWNRVLGLKRPGYDHFARQLNDLLSRATLREERAAEILLQVYPADAFWASLTGMKAGTHRWTAEFIACALDLTMPILFRFKHTFMCPRPWEFSARIEPLIETPGHGAWPSGHATEGHLCAVLLTALMTAANNTRVAVAGPAMGALAYRIGVNREVAGLHFPTDTTAGRLLGSTLAGLLLDIILEHPAPKRQAPRLLDGDAFYAGWRDDLELAGPEGLDALVEHAKARCAAASPAPAQPPAWPAGGPVAGAALGLRLLWDKAVAEWAP